MVDITYFNKLREIFLTLQLKVLPAIQGR